MGAGLLVAVAGLAGQGQCAAMTSAGVLGLACGRPGFPGAVQGLGLAAGVADRGEQGQRLLMVFGGVSVLVQSLADRAGSCQRMGLQVAVAALTGQGDCRGMAGASLVGWRVTSRVSPAPLSASACPSRSPTSW